MTDGDHDPDAGDLFESSAGDQLTRKQIVYYGWHEGNVEEMDSGFIVDSEEYLPVDQDSST